MNWQIRKRVCLSTVLTVLAGCGPATESSTDPDGFPFVQCKVQMAGKDVEGAIVGFKAIEGTTPQIVSHYDSEADCYRFTTNHGGTQKAGVPEGEYTVTVRPGRKMKTPIPAKYAYPSTSGLTVEIKEGKNFLPPFELTP